MANARTDNIQTELLFSVIERIQTLLAWFSVGNAVPCENFIGDWTYNFSNSTKAVFTEDRHVVQAVPIENSERLDSFVRLTGIARSERQPQHEVQIADSTEVRMPHSRHLQESRTRTEVSLNSKNAKSKIDTKQLGRSDDADAGVIRTIRFMHQSGHAHHRQAYLDVPLAGLHLFRGFAARCALFVRQ